jgi:3-hydroxyisobutyrate dehydrogenase-like beta-hydroxyacid dehydrogenase
MRAAVLGLGGMGSAVAARLPSGGHGLVVWNRTPGRAGHPVAVAAFYRPVDAERGGQADG